MSRIHTNDDLRGGFDFNVEREIFSHRRVQFAIQCVGPSFGSSGLGHLLFDGGVELWVIYDIAGLWLPSNSERSILKHTRT